MSLFQFDVCLLVTRYLTTVVKPYLLLMILFHNLIPKAFEVQ